MAKRDLSPAALEVVAAVRSALPDTGTVRIACSGGPDSLALAAATAWLKAHEPNPLLDYHGLIVDHGLQEGSSQVAAATLSVLSDLGIPASVVRVQVDGTSPDGPEAAAREARYTALRSGECDCVLLGHTLDDQAETVLLGLARGSGVRSLAGMPDRFGTAPVFVRPLLELRRATTVQACADWGLHPWQDPQNQQQQFLRVRVRGELMPVLREVCGERVDESLARTAILARTDADYLDELAAAALAAVGAGAGSAALDSAWLGAQPAALQGRILRLWLVDQGVAAPDFERTRACLALINDWHGQRGADLPGGVRLIRLRGHLELTSSD